MTTTTSLCELTREDLDALALGAGVLASGGGGDTGIGVSVARRVVTSVPIARASELPPDALVVHCGLAGAPDIVAERPPAGDELATAVRALEHHLGARAAALGVIEIGGLNALTPFVAAAGLGLPVVDGDLMGRAFPRLEQTVLAAAGMSAAPIVMVASTGETVLIDGPTPGGVDRVLRAVVPSFGGAASIACHPVTASTLARLGIAGSVSRALALGRAAPDALGERLFAGRVAEIRRESDQPLHSVVLEDPDDLSRVARIDMGEEYLAVAVDGLPVARVPEIVCLLDRDLGRPVGTGALRLGRHVIAIRVAPPRELLALETLVGPAAFGL